MNQTQLSNSFYLEMSQRRSIRKFTSETIDDEIIVNAVKAAGTAPSGANRQPWHFVIVKNQTIKDAIRAKAEEIEKEFYSKRAPKEWLKDLEIFKTDWQKPYLSEASHLICVFYKTKETTANGITQKTYYPLESTSIATGILLTSLHKSGVSTLTHTPKPCQFLNSLFGLDRLYRPLMIVVAGKAHPDYELPDIQRKAIHDYMEFR